MECGIVVVDVIILLFQLILRLYLKPSSENDGLNSKKFVKIGRPKISSMSWFIDKFRLSISILFSTL